jgi:hypothetical protein
LRVLFISGAPWGATGGNQRYQALAEAIKRNYPDVEVLFYAHVDGATPPEFRWTGEPVDILVVGFPEKWGILENQNMFCLGPIIYDVCDYWRGNELIENLDLRETDDYIAQKSHIIVTVNQQLACQYLSYKKPVYVIGNGIRKEAMTPPPVRTDTKVHIYYWGAYHPGQEWTDFAALREIPKRYPQCYFHYFLASPLPPEELFPEKPDNLSVEISPIGIDFLDIKAKIIYPAIGLVPFKPFNTAAAFADPIKIYEYWALGFHVIATNTWSLLGERETILYRQGDALQEISAGIEEIIKNRKLEPFFPPLSEKLAFSWDFRAKQYVDLFRRLIPGR